MAARTSPRLLAASAATAARAAEAEADRAGRNRSRHDRGRIRSRPGSPDRTGRDAASCSRMWSRNSRRACRRCRGGRGAASGSKPGPRPNAAGWRGEGVFMVKFLAFVRKRCVRFRYVNDISELSRCNVWLSCCGGSIVRRSTQRAHSASMRSEPQPVSRVPPRPKNRPSPSVQSMESRNSSRRLTSASASLGHRDHVLARLLGGDLAEQEDAQQPTRRETAGRPRDSSPIAAVLHARRRVMRYSLRPRAPMSVTSMSPASASLFSSPYSWLWVAGQTLAIDFSKVFSRSYPLPGCWANKPSAAIRKLTRRSYLHY